MISSSYRILSFAVSVTSSTLFGSAAHASSSKYPASVFPSGRLYFGKDQDPIGISTLHLSAILTVLSSAS